MNDIDGFIRSHSSSIGVDGIIQLNNIQRKILRAQMKNELTSQMNLVDVKTKYKNEMDYTKWSFAEGWLSFHSQTNDNIFLIV